MNEFGEQQRKRKEELIIKQENLYLKSEALINLNRYEEAIECLDNLLVLDPTCVPALIGKGRALLYLNRFDDAIKCFEEVISLNPEDSNVLNDSWLGKAEGLIKLKKYKEAFSCCDKIIELHGLEYVGTLREILNLFIDAKRYSETKEWLDKTLSKHLNENSLLSLKKDVSSVIQKEFELLLGSVDDLNNQKKYKAANKCLNKALEFKQKLYYIFYLKGETFINRNNYKKAINCFNESLKKDPMYVPALIGKGRALLYLNRFDDAIKCFEEVISLNPEDSNVLNDSWLGKAEGLIKLKRYEEAFSCCDKIIESHHQGYVGTLRKIVNLFIDEGRCSEAKKCLYRALSKYPNEKSLLSLKKDELPRIQKREEKEQEEFELLLGSVDDLNNQKKYKAANKCLNKALEFKQKLYYIFYLKGETFINRNNYKKAINCFNESLKEDPMYVPALIGKGRALLYLNRFDDAIKCFEEVISLNPEDSNVLNDSWLGKAEGLIKLKRYEEAFSCCDKIIESHHQGYVGTLRKIVNLFIDAKRYSETKKWLDKALSKHPNENSLLSLKKEVSSVIQKEFELLLGSVDDLNNQKKYKAANKCLNKALEFKQKLYYIFYLKGETFINLNRYEEAINCFDKSLKEDPMYVPSLIGKGNALMHLKNYKEAINCFDESLELDYAYPTLIAKGNALRHLKNYRDAFECFEEVISSNPEDSNALNDSWGGEAVIYIQLKRYEEAFSCCDRIIELHGRGYVGTLRKIVNLFIDAKRYSETKKWLDKALLEYPNEKFLLSLKEDVSSHMQKEKEQKKFKPMLEKIHNLNNQERYGGGFKLDKLLK